MRCRPVRQDASGAVVDAIQSGINVAKIELIDALSAEISNDYLDTGLPDAPMVFLEFHANHGVEREVGFCRTIFEEHDVQRFEVAETDAETISKRLVERAIELGGTSTGEHGVGTGKQEYLAAEGGDASVEAMRAIKEALDPAGILNPGKIFPEEDG